MTTNKKATASRAKNTKKAPTKKATPKVSKSAVLAHLATARSANMKKGVKPFYTDNGAQLLAKAIERAFVIPTLSSADITTSKSKIEAQARREFARKHRATIVNFADILGEGKEGEITHDRPENTVRARLQSICRAMGLPADTLYSVRAESYREGETPSAYIVRK